MKLSTAIKRLSKNNEIYKEGAQVYCVKGKTKVLKLFVNPQSEYVADISAQDSYETFWTFESLKSAMNFVGIV